MKLSNKSQRQVGRRIANAMSALTITALAALNLMLASYAPTALAEDIDIFTVNPSISALRPNVLIFVDNTANWGSGNNPQPFGNEKSALVSAVAGLDDRFNVGWGGFTETGSPNDNSDGAYIRAAVRQMTSANKSKLGDMVGNLDSNWDKGNNATYGLAMAEMYRYFGGLTSTSGFGKLKRDYSGNSRPVVGNDANSNPKLVHSNAVWALPDNAFANSGTKTYTSPISDACQKNFIIFISNGPAQDNDSSTKSATDALTGYGGSTAQIPLNPNGSQGNVADEWSRFMSNTDVDATRPGKQNIVTYTIDINPGTQNQGRAHTALLMSMANEGKGRYFAVSSANGGAQISDALNEIFREVLAVNSVFAASALPASVNARGTFLNQVYMGMFRPDPQGRPRWAGNLKQYKLGDSNGKVVLVDGSSPARAVENQVTGFINDNVRSFWTQDSTFWNATSYPEVQGTGGVSDAPDGALVEKGGAAFRLRTELAADVTKRKLYTCSAGGCSSGLLSSTFDTTNGDLTAAALGDASLDKDEVIRWIRGENRKLNDNATATATVVRGYIHGDVVHSKPAVVNYGSGNIWVFYGSNDGVLHALKGGQATTDGKEEWGFVAPEFFDRFARLYKNSPAISSGTADSKTYFFDGPISVHAVDSSKRIMFVSARRGGRMIYALDISDPAAPKFLWRIRSTDAGFEELGLSFGEVRVAKVRGQTNPVAVISAGYDAAANEPSRGTATMGRGVFLVDALTGTLIWSASKRAGSSLVVNDMDYAIAADPVVIDSNADSYADRIYLADTGANIWRVNIDDGATNPTSSWAVAKVASLGGSGANNDRKFLQAPDVVPFDETYDALLIGSGDRENPLETTVENYFFMVKDAHALTALPASPRVLSDLFNATSSYAVPSSAVGWYFGLRTGEKVVTGSTTLNGATFFSTNQPESVLPTGASCSAGLGQARDYVVSFRTSGPIRDFDVSGTLTVEDRSEDRAGGGLPPSPIAVTVCDGLKKCSEVVLSGSKASPPPPVVLGRRFRSFWNLQNERK